MTHLHFDVGSTSGSHKLAEVILNSKLNRLLVRGKSCFFLRVRYLNRNESATSRLQSGNPCGCPIADPGPNVIRMSDELQ